jgi:hypothetical protein
VEFTQVEAEEDLMLQMEQDLYQQEAAEQEAAEIPQDQALTQLLIPVAVAVAAVAAQAVKVALADQEFLSEKNYVKPQVDGLSENNFKLQQVALGQ